MSEEPTDEELDAIELIQQIEENEAAEARTIAFIGEPKPKRNKRITRSQMTKWTSEMQDFMQATEWEDAEPKHFVALYAWLYHKVYGFECALLQGGDDAARACGGARRCLSEFADDATEFASYMRWLWARETAHERYRRDNKQEGRVMSWHLSFSTKMVVEYRIQKARRR